MKQVMDKFKNTIKKNKKINIFLLSLTIVGIIMGAIFIVIINKSDQQLVKNYLETFLNNIESGNTNYAGTFINGLISSVLMIIGIWLLGISIIGAPVTLLLYFSKTFILGFSVASLIQNYSFKGILISLVYIFPHRIISILVLIFLVSYSLLFSLKLGLSFISKKSINIKNLMNTYFYVLIVCLILNIFTVLFEVFITPNLLKLLIPILK